MLIFLLHKDSRIPWKGIRDAFTVKSQVPDKSMYTYPYDFFLEVLSTYRFYHMYMRTIFRIVTYDQNKHNSHMVHHSHRIPCKPGYYCIRIYKLTRGSEVDYVPTDIPVTPFYVLFL